MDIVVNSEVVKEMTSSGLNMNHVLIASMVINAHKSGSTFKMKNTEIADLIGRGHVYVTGMISPLIKSNWIVRNIDSTKKVDERRIFSVGEKLEKFV